MQEADESVPDADGDERRFRYHYGEDERPDADERRFRYHYGQDERPDADADERQFRYHYGEDERPDTDADERRFRYVYGEDERPGADADERRFRYHYGEDERPDADADERPGADADERRFRYHYGADERPDADADERRFPVRYSAFLLEKDLVRGTRKYLSFSNTQKIPKFLPRSVADEIPFSSDKLSAVLRQLNIAPDSVMGLAMKQNLQDCEAPGVKGETKYCATSLESMIDYITSKLGSNGVTVLATNVPKGKTSKSVKHQYSITGVKYESQGEKPVYVCHSIKYPYAVYYCHQLQGTKIARVWVKGEDGSTAEAPTICHTDTSAWNPKHMAFRVLNVKPGAASVCHFVPENHFVWLGAN
ncbi:BURP domain-containing protein 5 [Cryptomeria japonica]|uniref:BURP domain-containing protein 5 n=1 Tax=Cryptomeria japonica TaxID=3369 RepID=UPI0027D9DAFA|nr:BURP domain-containing protein 5 [Cryptomeria japonica]